MASKYLLSSVSGGTSLIYHETPIAGKIKSLVAGSNVTIGDSNGLLTISAASGGITNPVTITSGTIDGCTIGRTNTDQSLPVVVAVTGTTKTLALTDANTIQGCNNASAQTITIALNATVAFATNTTLIFQQQGAGLVTVQGEAGVTVNAIDGGSVVTTGRYTTLYIIKTGTNAWLALSATTGITGITGDITASGVGTVSGTVNSIGGQAVTLGGTLTTVGAFNTAFTLTGNSNVTLPTSGTLLVNDLSNLGNIAHSLLFSPDATYAIGAAGANRPVSIFCSGTVTSGALSCTGNATVGGTMTTTGSTATGSSSGYVFTSRSRMQSSADGFIEFKNNAQSANASILALDISESNNKRVSTQFDATSTTTLANVTGLSATVVASSVYAFTAILYTTSDVAAGVKAAIAGTATATSIIYEGTTVGTASTRTRATALATAVGAVTTETVATITITGTITVNAGGTLTVQFAQNASSATPSSVLVGSILTLRRLQ